MAAREIDGLKDAFRRHSAGPFGNRPRFVLLGPEIEGSSGSGRVGTYGTIRGAPAYILGAVAEKPFAFEDFGYCLEGIILEATALGLGTCWLGGTFDRASAVRSMGLSGDEMVPAVTPVGRAADRRGLVDVLIHGTGDTRPRKPWDELFFSGSFHTPLEPGDDPWTAALDCVRIGPSASNRQPWRIVREDGPGSPGFHLYLREDRAYNHMLGRIRLQNMDMGIAMFHLEAAARALGLPGAWKRMEPAPIPAVPPLAYVASFAGGA